MRRPKGYYACKKTCEICEGSGRIEAGMEGFINSSMEQDCRDIYEPCENAIFIEKEYPDRREEE